MERNADGTLRVKGSLPATDGFLRGGELRVALVTATQTKGEPLTDDERDGIAAQFAR